MSLWFDLQTKAISSQCLLATLFFIKRKLTTQFLPGINSFFCGLVPRFILLSHFGQRAYLRVTPGSRKLTSALCKKKGAHFKASKNMFPGLKKLRRLPHIFNNVLELPFHSDADVAIEENPGHFRFVVTTDAVGKDVRTHTIEIYPGVTKIVLRGGNILELNFDELEIDIWRFRLPLSIRPELASAVYVNGELIVTVPKSLNSDTADMGNTEKVEIWGEDGTRVIRGGGGRLILVH